MEVTVRVLPADARVARVSASVDGTPAAALRGGGSAGEWHGAVAVRPGPHAVRIEAFDAGGAPLRETAVAVTADRGHPVEVDATVATAPR